MKMRKPFTTSRLQQEERGSNMVEFALVVGVMTILVLTLADGALATFSHSILQSATLEGARYGVTSYGDTTGVKTVVRNNLVSLKEESAIIIVTYPNGNEVCVTALYGHRFITPVLSGLFGSNLLPLMGSACTST